MSILKPTAGQLLDRHALLLVKVGRAGKSGAPSEHFRQEALEVWEELKRRLSARLPEFEREAKLLLDLHLAMWPLVERAEAGDETVSAVELHRLNRRRCEVREEIDRLCGEYRGPEKV